MNPRDFSISPLCTIPSDIARQDSRLFAARQTLDHASDALLAICKGMNADDEFGLSLLLQTVTRAVQHAESLLYASVGERPL